MARLVRHSGMLDGDNAIADELFRAQPHQGRRDRSVLVDEWRENVAVFVVGALERRMPTEHEDGGPGQLLGRARAYAGVPAAEVLQSVFLHQRLFFNLVSSLAPPTPDRERMLLELLSRLQNWSTWFMIGLADGHRGAELAISRRAQELQDAFVWQLISGTYSSLENGSGIEAHGLRRTCNYHAFRAKIGSEEERATLEQFLQLLTPAGRRVGMMTVVNGEACGFATVLPDAPPPVAIGISAARPLDQLPAAFRQATRALEATLALGRREIASMETVGLHAAVVADRDVGRLLDDRYLAKVRTLGAAGETLIETVRCFVNHCGRLEPTARDLDVHPNTVRYRLARFESITGCSLHNSDAIVEIWWALAWNAVDDSTTHSVATV